MEENSKKNFLQEPITRLFQINFIIKRGNFFLNFCALKHGPPFGILEKTKTNLQNGFFSISPKRIFISLPYSDKKSICAFSELDLPEQICYRFKKIFLDSFFQNKFSLKCYHYYWNNSPFLFKTSKSLSCLHPHFRIKVHFFISV